MITAQSLLQKFTNMKTLPHLAIKLSKMISDDNRTIQEFEEVIKMDPTMVLRLLRLVNSPYYALRQKCTSISDAVIYVGMDNLRNIVVTTALKDIYKVNPNESVFSRKRLWLHSAAVSICSQMISERIFAKKGENAFLCGILHDIGFIVEDQTIPDLFIEVCKTYDPKKNSITDYELEIIGTDHSAIGNTLANDWKLPEEVRKGIKQHHKIMTTVEPSSIPGIIQIAEFMVSRLDYTTIPEMHPELSPPLKQYIHDNIKEFRLLARELPEEMAKARELHDLDAE
ncbi:MAG: HDOD domain-containing protein [Proteobacteria bacterium]|nr:HDOD domain-containing protein [Pseudomonadota bacterium]